MERKVLQWFQIQGTPSDVSQALLWGMTPALIAGLLLGAELSPGKSNSCLESLWRSSRCAEVVVKSMEKGLEGGNDLRFNQSAVGL